MYLSESDPESGSVWLLWLMVGEKPRKGKESTAERNLIEQRVRRKTDKGCHVDSGIALGRSLLPESICIKPVLQALNVPDEGCNGTFTL